MTVRQLIPEGLARLAPGPELGVLLGGLDISAVTGTDLVEVLRARARQLAHEQAQLLAVMVEVGLSDPQAGPDGVARLAQAPEFAADEIRAALAWTRNAAYREYHFAETLVMRLPAVFTALDTGVICRSKAWLFTELCAGLTDEQAQVVCQRLLPDAGRLTTGELAARIKKLALALDPEWAARRYTSAVADRDVIGYLDEHGTATVSGRRLPTDQAAAACARIEDLAKAAKRAGHPGRIGPLRADVYVGLLEGRWQQLTREEIIADLLACATPEATPQDPTEDIPREPTDDIPQDPTPSGPAADDALADGDAGPNASTTPDNGDGVGQPAAADQVGVELRVGMSTLLGRDRHPGEIPGWGPVTAGTARTIVAAQRSGEWRYAITDAQGQLILAGITRRRPTLPAVEALRRRRGGVVELHVPAALLTELAAHHDACGEWAAVITDLAAQYAADRTPGARVAPGQDPAARFAGVVLRRYVQIRDRVCVHPGCRCSAVHADLDHTVDHAHGGLTIGANLGDACRHDHRLKGEGGWILHQPQPGVFRWTSRLGHTYHVHPPPIIEPLPDPIPRDRPPYPLMIPVDDGWEDTEIWEDPSPEPEPKPDPPPEPDPSAEIPPF